MSLALGACCCSWHERSAAQPSDAHALTRRAQRRGVTPCTTAGVPRRSLPCLAQLLRLPNPPAKPPLVHPSHRVTKPDVVEAWDVTSEDPRLLVHLKSYRNTIPVPKHWCQKRKFLMGKRGVEKPPFQLPDFIAATGIERIRASVLEKENAKKLKGKMKEKMQPKMGKIDIDYQVRAARSPPPSLGAVRAVKASREAPRPSRLQMTSLTRPHTRAPLRCCTTPSSSSSPSRG